MTLPAGIAFSSSSARDEIHALLASCRLPVDDIGQHTVFLVARAEGQLCGTAGMDRLGSVALLRSLAVPAAWRGRGIGRALCDQLIRHAREEGLSRVFLLTTDARAFFSQLGFAAVEREAVPPEVRGTRQFRELCPQTATVMTREI